MKKLIKVHITFLFILFLSGCGISSFKAAEKGEVSLMKSILAKGVDINRGNLTGSTPLHIACRYGKVEMVNFLISNFAAINKRDSFMRTPLHIASKYGQTEVVKLLLDKGAKVSSRDNHGNTPLLCAAEKGHLEEIKILTEYGAKTEVRNSFSESAVHLARQNGHNNIIAWLRNISSGNIVADRTPPVIEILSPLTRGLRAVSEDEKIFISGKVTDKSGIKKLLMNGRDISFSKDGHFKERVTVNGLSVFEFKAIDNHGNYTFEKVQIEKKNSGKNFVRQEGKYFALIIGNNSYTHLTNLKTAVADAREVERILMSMYGFKTTLLINSTKLKLSRALNRLRKEISVNDHLLIYYAGHGIFDEKVNKAYWLPVDAEKDDDTNWIIADTITTNIRRFKARHILVISDSCYSGTLTRKAATSLYKEDLNDEYISKMLGRTSRTLLASGGNEPVADGLGGKHSIFASSLIKGLKRSWKIFTAEDLFYKNIKESVAGKSNQVPQYTIIRNSGHGGGDFVFRRK